MVIFKPLRDLGTNNALNGPAGIFQGRNLVACYSVPGIKRSGTSSEVTGPKIQPAMTVLTASIAAS